MVVFPSESATEDAGAPPGWHFSGSPRWVSDCGVEPDGTVVIEDGEGIADGKEACIVGKFPAEEHRGRIYLRCSDQARCRCGVERQQQFVYPLLECALAVHSSIKAHVADIRVGQTFDRGSPSHLVTIIDDVGQVSVREGMSEPLYITGSHVQWSRQRLAAVMCN